MVFERIDAGGNRHFSYLIADADSRVGAVVDPGYDTSQMEARVQALRLRGAYVLNTHTHHDHVAGNGVFRRRRGNRGRSLSWTFFTRGCRGPGRARKAPMTDRMACSH